jgi:translation elongation factor EF-1alpha
LFVSNNSSENRIVIGKILAGSITKCQEVLLVGGRYSSTIRVTVESLACGQRPIDSASAGNIVGVKFGEILHQKCAPEFEEKVAKLKGDEVRIVLMDITNLQKLGLRVGMILCSVSDPTPLVRELSCQMICQGNRRKQGRIELGTSMTMFCHCLSVQVKVIGLISLIDKFTCQVR